MKQKCLYCNAESSKMRQVNICVGDDTVPDYLCKNCVPDDLSGLWTRQHMKNYINEHLEKGYVFIVYYNSESQCDDGIENAHSTITGAVEWVRKYYAGTEYYDGLDLILSDVPSGTKGVNMPGWSIGTFNIYRIALKQ